MKEYRIIDNFSEESVKRKLIFKKSEDLQLKMFISKVHGFLFAQFAFMYLFVIVSGQNEAIKTFFEDNCGATF